MNYRIIDDIVEFEKFYAFLPETSERFKYYLTLLARRKYGPLTDDKVQLTRKTCHKKDILNKIQQMEVARGVYKQSDETHVPQQNLATYISINLRDLWKASVNSLKMFADVVGKGEKEFNVNPHQKVMSEIQKSGKSNYILFDIDVAPKVVLLPETGNDDRKDVLVKFFEVLQSPNHPIIKTKNGFHVLVNPKNIPSTITKNWYMELKKYSDVVGDEMSPVPGTLQGNTLVEFYRDFNDYNNPPPF